MEHDERALAGASMRGIGMRKTDSSFAQDADHEGARVQRGFVADVIKGGSQVKRRLVRCWTVPACPLDPIHPRRFRRITFPLL